MFSAATKTAVGGGGETEFSIRSLVTAVNLTDVTIPANTQPNDLIIYIERGFQVSIVPGFSIAVSVSSASGRGASVTYLVATTADAGRVIQGMPGLGSNKVLGVFYTNLITPVYTLVSAYGQITDSNPAGIVIGSTSVSGAGLVVGAFSQTGGTSAARTFLPAATTTVFANVGGGGGTVEARVLLNSETTCTLDMGDEGNSNTLLAVYFVASED